MWGSIILEEATNIFTRYWNPLIPKQCGARITFISPKKNSWKKIVERKIIFKMIINGVWLLDVFSNWLIFSVILCYLPNACFSPQVLLQYFTPTLPLCLLLPWLREFGFVIFYGAVDLKLYRYYPPSSGINGHFPLGFNNIPRAIRILMQFRTRKAHCWTISDKDLLKYLLYAITVVTVYLAAWTSVSLNFFNEGWDPFIHLEIEDGQPYSACKPQWWNHVTELGNFSLLFCTNDRRLNDRQDQRCFIHVQIINPVSMIVRKTIFIQSKSGINYFEWSLKRVDIFSFYLNAFL